jgi:hypothetical protein
VITNAGASYIVTFAHTSASTFVAGANDGLGNNYYGLLNPAATGVPTGGTTRQALVKLSNTNYNVGWGDIGVPLGGTTGQFLKKVSNTDLDTSWASIPGLLPTAGATGQVLIKNSSTNYDVIWGDVAFGFGSNSTSNNYTLALTDANKIIQSFGDLTITIPNDSSVPFPDNTLIIIVNNDGGVTTISKASGVGLSPNAQDNYILEKPNAIAFLIKGSPNYWTVAGDLCPAIRTTADSGTVSVDFTPYGIIKRTPTADITYNNTASTVRRNRLVFIFTTSGTTSYDITFGTNFISQGVLATGTVSGKRFVVEFQGDSTNYYEVGARGAAM